MGVETETLVLLDEIESLVSDKLQVVSYKWLSRNFLLSSNASKRLLQEFVDTRGNGLEVVYALSGWLKNNNPPNYHVRLVSSPKLEEVKEEFDGNCSIQVYSVQASIPKDPAAIWNTEFIQAVELFKQPPGVDNCLRDNRFCEIANPFVKRNVDGTTPNIPVPQSKFAGTASTSSTGNKTTTEMLSRHSKVQSSPKVAVQVANVAKDVKTESNVAGSVDEKATLLPIGKKKGQGDTNSSVNGGSLANMWGRASANSKVAGSPAEASNLIVNPAASAEAQICAREAVDMSSDEEDQNVDFKRASNDVGNRKRRVVLHYSDDEDEAAANLSSPDLPKVQSAKTLPSKKPNVNDKTEDKPIIKEGTSTEGASNRLVKKDSSAVSKNIETKTDLSETIHGSVSGDDLKENRAANAASSSPKRRKVLKTRIDERGREVTEVVWEGEEMEEKKVENDNKKKPENNKVTSAPNNRAPAAATKKSPAVGNMAPSNQGGKAGNTKKGGNKDPKQGNILSFFKRV